MYIHCFPFLITAPSPFQVFLEKNFKYSATSRPNLLIAYFYGTSRTSLKERMAAIAKAKPYVALIANGGDSAFRGLLKLVATLDTFGWMSSGVIVSDLTLFFSSFFPLFGMSLKVNETAGSLINSEIEKAKPYMQAFDQSIKTEVTNITSEIVRALSLLDQLTDRRYTKYRSSRSKYHHQTRRLIDNNEPVLKKLGQKIDEISTRNTISERKVCFRSIELYSKIMSVWEIVIIRYISYLPNDGVQWHQYAFREFPKYIMKARNRTRRMLTFLHDPSKRNKLMVYFNGRDYPITNAYMESILKIPRPNDFPAARYCISHNRVKYDWFVGPAPDHKHVFGQNPIHRGCAWEILSHGNNLYSIFNKQFCPGDRRCDESLSYGLLNGTITVTVAKDRPVLWELHPISGRNLYE